MTETAGPPTTDDDTSDFDECSGCEGWGAVDARRLCSSCSHDVDHDPWYVTTIDGTVVMPGPYPRDLAEHVARIHNDPAYYQRDELRAARAASGGAL